MAPKLHPKLFTGGLICIYFLTKHILSNSAGSIILSNIKRCHTCKCFNSVFLQKSKTMYIYLWVIGIKLCVYLRVHACSWADFFTSLYSQAMKQWWQLKVDNFDTILFFKVLCELHDFIINSLILTSWQDENFVPWLATWADEKEWSCPFRTKKAEKSYLTLSPVTLSLFFWSMSSHLDLRLSQ